MVFIGPERRTGAQDRRLGVTVGSILLLAVVAAAFAPRSLVTATVGLAFLHVTWMAKAGGLRCKWQVSDGPLAFCLLVTVASVGWSAAPWVTASSAAGLVGWCAVGWMATHAARCTAFPHTAHIAEGLWIGYLLAAVYLVVEAVSGQSLRIFAYNAFDVPRAWLRPETLYVWRGETLIAIREMDLTRSAVPVVLLMWPACLALRSATVKPNAALWQAALGGLGGVAVALLGNETAKVAFLASVLVFVAACCSGKWTGRVLTGVWVACCLAVVPTVLALYHAGMHEVAWLPFSARHRVVIWANIAEQIMQTPWWGTGAGLKPDGIVSTALPEEVARTFPPLANHAHSVFLQVWSDLGLVGATAFAIWGVAVLRTFQTWPSQVRSYALATFTAAMVMAGTSYGLWQHWFVAAYVLMVLALAYALRANETAGSHVFHDRR